MTEPIVDEASTPSKSKETRLASNAIKVIQEALQGLRFGQLTIVVHEGTVVQVERLEKRRVPLIPD